MCQIADSWCKKKKEIVACRGEKILYFNGRGLIFLMNTRKGKIYFPTGQLSRILVSCERKIWDWGCSFQFRDRADLRGAVQAGRGPRIGVLLPDGTPGPKRAYPQDYLADDSY
ncbi:hypothetical protein CEXT_679101 [Caerostris extrusa]|uniref:Uncharacterized protein n=1 Tax=Caerostris extrusa TaxID=172846 RepID=A0AAV4SRH9_CAEEX|nr:hypothetical protein CEXT_679101 [Caerostris extrusa]